MSSRSAGRTHRPRVWSESAGLECGTDVRYAGTILVGMRNVLVYGLGLIGGSVALAAAKAGWNVMGVERDADSVALAVRAGIPATTDPQAGLEWAAAHQALIVVAVPLPVLGEVCAAILRWAPECTVTDVTSVKTRAVAIATDAGLADRFIPGHPMAGTQHSGFAHAFPELFHDATWVIGAPIAGQEYSSWQQRAAEVLALVQAVGARPIIAEAAAHDDAAARISHLPHAVALGVLAAGNDGGELAAAMAAGSFRDGTRVARTRPELIAAMLDGNREALLPVLRECIDRLTRIADVLQQGESTLPLVAELQTQQELTPLAPVMLSELGEHNGLSAFPANGQPLN